MSETTKRGVCKALGCEYDKCQWRDDGYGGGGGYSEDVSSAKYFTGGYIGGGSNNGGYNNGGSNNGGYSGGGYSGGGSNNGGYNSIKEYKTVAVKEDRADKYTGGEPIEEYTEEETIEEYQEEEPIEEFKEEEEEEEEVEVEEVLKYDDKEEHVAPSWISSKVEVVDPEPTEESYETACDDVSFFSDLSFALHVTLV